MVSNKMKLEAMNDAIADLQRRTSELEREYDNYKYQLQCEMRSFLKAWTKEEVGYVVVKRDRDEIVAQLKDNITEAILKDIK